MRMAKLAAGAAIALALAACGGGGSGSSPPSTGGGGGGTPTPTPTPTASYQTFAQLTGNQAFNAACAGIYNQQLGVPSAGYARYPNPPQALAIDFTSASSEWRVIGRSPDGVEFNNTFGPVDVISTSLANTTAYRKVDANGFPTRFQITQPTLGSTLAEYARVVRTLARPGTGITDWACAIGVPTLLTDRPGAAVTYTDFAAIGTVFSQAYGGTGQYDISESTATLTANPVNGQIRVTVTLVGRAFLAGGGLSDTRTQFGQFGGDAGIDGSVQSFGAPLNRLPDNSVGGDFSGWFFGPQGREAAFAFQYTGPDANQNNMVFSGVISARR